MDWSAQQEELEEEVRGLKSILTVAQVVVSSLDLDEVLQNILCSAMAIMDMPAGSIALYDEEQEQRCQHDRESTCTHLWSPTWLS